MRTWTDGVTDGTDSGGGHVGKNNENKKRGINSADGGRSRRKGKKLESGDGSRKESKKPTMSGKSESLDTMPAPALLAPRDRVKQRLSNNLSCCGAF